ncbi:MAG: hypothetical protein KJ621_17850 [Proteobacteria bacterium]|nr:hypothetical protein [Pseudomonadota bacterium]MBU1740931.1 hypothetical protein [Pseudomonadota bacterium]
MSKRRSVRAWSNRVLGSVAVHCRGRVLNCSGWRDEDKEGGRYRDYFPGASEYRVSNYGGDRGESGVPDEIRLDLTAPLPADMSGRFDVVLSHTVLEHVFDLNRAVDNLCLLTTDLLIVVVPFAQHYHPGESYGDYWRLSISGLEEMLARRGLPPVFADYSTIPHQAVYVLVVGSRHPERWQETLSAIPRQDPALLGDSLYQDARRRLRRLALRFLTQAQLSAWKRAVLSPVRLLRRGR